ncbi:MAG: hypothetical protein JWM40_1167 [Frankiales bacterium]|nr:hypothetical protein [Frankiales bacterium]
MRRLVLLVLCLALTAACGSTVQVRGQATTTAGGLAADGLDTTGTGATSAPTVTGDQGAQGSGPGGPTALPGTATAGTGGGTTTTTAPGQSVGGSAATHQSIQIGFITTSVGNAAAAGLNTGSTYTDRAMYDAFVSEYNLKGGLAGHRIVPVYGNSDTASTNWGDQFSQVCAKFTQDNKVKAVIGYIFVFLPSFESCLAHALVPHLYAGYQPGDVAAQRQFPTLVSTAHPTVEGSYLAVLEGALASGRLTKKSKLGVMLDSCSNGDRAFASSTEPWLKAHGIDYQAVIMNCAQGSSDVSAAAAAVSSAELRFASTGVDLVFAGGIPLLLFMEDAQSQSYHPHYITTVGGAGLEANAPAAQMANLHGFGWMPSVDVNPGHQPYGRTATQTACLAKLAKHGLRPVAYNDFMQAYATCDGLELYARALERTAGVTDPTPVVQAVQGLSPSFLGSATYAGRLTVASHQRGGASTYREYGWTTSCSCLTYRGPTYPMPNP